MGAFDEDTAVERIEPGRYRATVTGRWNVFGVPNGGYLMAVALAAVEAELNGSAPLTATTHFLRPATADSPADVTVEVIRTGRAFQTAAASLIQDGKERLRTLVTVGEPDAGVTLVTGVPPPLEGPEAYAPSSLDTGPVVMAQQFDYRSPVPPERIFTGGGTGSPEIGGWIRFEDGRQPDTRSLALFADAFPPPVLLVMPPTWVPTIELTVHFRARPAPGWLLAWFKTRYVTGGFLDEDGEIWDSEGRLVALSRQLARLPA